MYEAPRRRHAGREASSCVFGTSPARSGVARETEQLECGSAGAAAEPPTTAEGEPRERVLKSHNQNKARIS